MQHKIGAKIAPFRNFLAYDYEKVDYLINRKIFNHDRGKNLK